MPIRSTKPARNKRAKGKGVCPHFGCIEFQKDNEKWVYDRNVKFILCNGRYRPDYKFEVKNNKGRKIYLTEYVRGRYAPVRSGTISILYADRYKLNEDTCKYEKSTPQGRFSTYRNCKDSSCS